MDEASLVAATSLGGDFGFSGQVPAAEGGALAGLLKSIIVECWTAGYRTIPIKIVDAPAEEPPAGVVAAICRELAVASYDVEIGLVRGERSVVARCTCRSILPRAGRCATARLGLHRWGTRHHGAGGTRTGQRYGLKLHLIGTAPAADRSRLAESRRSSHQNAAQFDHASGPCHGRNTGRGLRQGRKIAGDRCRSRKLAALGIWPAIMVGCLRPPRVGPRARGDSLPGWPDRRNSARGRYRQGYPLRPQGARQGRQCIRAKTDGAAALMEADSRRTAGLVRRLRFDQRPLRRQRTHRLFAGQRHALQASRLVPVASGPICRRSPFTGTPGETWAWRRSRKPGCALEMIDMQFMPAREGVGI